MGLGKRGRHAEQCRCVACGVLMRKGPFHPRSSGMYRLQPAGEDGTLTAAPIAARAKDFYRLFYCVPCAWRKQARQTSQPLCIHSYTARRLKEAVLISRPPSPAGPCENPSYRTTTDGAAAEDEDQDEEAASRDEQGRRLGACSKGFWSLAPAGGGYPRLTVSDW